jgi:hypothetical protein
METNNKLREALMQIYDRVNSLDENCGVDPVEIRDIARAALAAPPRNCDRFATADGAIGAYRQTHRYMVVNVFLDWLFATSTEKEGGAK